MKLKDLTLQQIKELCTDATGKGACKEFCPFPPAFCYKDFLQTIYKALGENHVSIKAKGYNNTQ